MRATVSIVQFLPAFAEPEENVRRLELLFNSVEGNQLVILTELSNSGYNFEGCKEAYQYS